MSAAAVSIIIPTQRRPQGLAVAVRSVVAQLGVDFAGLELVIVDNDQAPSARRLAAELGAKAPLTVRYVHEPRPGVAFARNAAVAASTGALIAFLDDDEEASPGWLAALIATQAAFGADAVFGPVRARAPARVRRHRPYFEQFFSRAGPAEPGLIDHHYGCGDSLIRRAALPDQTAPFSASRNQIGGEDNLLFQSMRETGARFAWAPDAWVWEDPDPARLSLGYTIRRAFAYGQAPSSDCAAATPPDRLGVVRWMAIGAAQAAGFGLIAAGKWLLGSPDRAWALDRAARGLGKTLWWGPFRIRFYGHAA